MAALPMNAVFLLVTVAALAASATACSSGSCQLYDKCSSDSDCRPGLSCSACVVELKPKRCVRVSPTNPFTTVNNSLPYNKYAYLTTHNSYAITGEPSHTGVSRLTFSNQEHSVTQQLHDGVRALMLDTYDFQGEIWLCHAPKGKCDATTAFGKAIDTMKEIEAFLAANPGEIVTLILEDYVESPNGLTKLFDDSGLRKYWFPVTKMPQSGQDWPLVRDMIAGNQRLVVFTSKRSKEATEGIAYQWNYMVENQYGDGGMQDGKCFNRGESAALNDRSKSLVLVNYFPSVPIKELACRQNSEKMVDMLNTCYGASGNRWANFLAVDFYTRSDGGGPAQAIDMLNGQLMCGCRDLTACMIGSPGTCSMSDKAAMPKKLW